MINRIKKKLKKSYSSYIEKKNIGPFLSTNKSFWDSYSSINRRAERCIVLCECNVRAWTYGHMALSQIASKALNSNVAYFGNKSGGKILRESFGSSIHIDIQTIVEEHKEIIKYDTDTIFSNINNINDILDIRYNKLLIGDLIYDSVLRTGYWQATITEINPKLYNVIKAAIELIVSLDYIFSNYDVKATIFTHKTSIAGIPLRYSANKKVLSISGAIGNGTIRKYYSFNGRRLPYSQSVPKKFIDIIENNKKLKKSILSKSEIHLEKRLKGALEKDIASQKANRGKKIYTDKSTFCSDNSLNENQSNVFVMLHAFNDMPHHFDDAIFLDYYRWFIETLKIAKKVKTVNWIFKEHPNSDMYPNDSNLAGIFEICDESNILFIDKNADFSSNSIRYIASATYMYRNCRIRIQLLRNPCSNSLKWYSG